MITHSRSTRTTSTIPSLVCHTSHTDTCELSVLYTLSLPSRMRPFPAQSQLEQSDAWGVPLASTVNETQLPYSGADGTKTKVKPSESRALGTASVLQAPWAAIAKSKLESITIQAAALRRHFPVIGKTINGLNNAPITGGPARNPDNRPVCDYLKANIWGQLTLKNQSSGIVWV
jgi:hypothetical protein